MISELRCELNISKNYDAAFNSNSLNTIFRANI